MSRGKRLSPLDEHRAELDELFSAAAQLSPQATKRLAAHWRVAVSPDLRLGRGSAAVPIRDDIEFARQRLGVRVLLDLRARAKDALWTGEAGQRRMAAWYPWERWSAQAVDLGSSPRLTALLGRLTIAFFATALAWMTLHYLLAELPDHAWAIGPLEKAGLIAMTVSLALLVGALGIMTLVAGWLPLTPAHATEGLLYAAMATALDGRESGSRLIAPWQALESGRRAEPIGALVRRLRSVVGWSLLMMAIAMPLFVVGIDLGEGFLRLLLSAVFSLIAWSGVAWIAADVHAIRSGPQPAIALLKRLPSLAVGGLVLLVGGLFIVGVVFGQ